MVDRYVMYIGYPRDESTRLTRDVTLGDFASGGDYPRAPIIVAESLVLLIQRMTDALRIATGEDNVGVRINSGYRIPSHNRAVGGVASSWHQTGLAADVAFNWDLLDNRAGIGQESVGGLARALGAGEIGVASTYIHVSVARGDYSIYTYSGAFPEVKTTVPNFAEQWRQVVDPVALDHAALGMDSSPQQQVPQQQVPAAQAEPTKGSDASAIVPILAAGALAFMLL